jgi:spore maturation protein CgeB
MYRTRTDFYEQVDYYLSHPEERRARAERLRSCVLSAHTFACRADVSLARIRELDKQERGIEELSVRARADLPAAVNLAAKS